MATYKVEFVKSAQKEFDRLAAKLQVKMAEALSMLAQNPFSELLRVKKLKGVDDLYRIRVGDYRVVYEIRNEQLIVLVVKIGHRRDIYRR